MIDVIHEDHELRKVRRSIRRKKRPKFKSVMKSENMSSPPRMVNAELRKSLIERCSDIIISKL